MSQNRPPVPVIIIVLLTIIGVGAYYLINLNQQAQANLLTASGTVEAAQISIAPELAGKVIEVQVEEGDAVSAGDVLFRLDATLLEAQRSLAAASLSTAKAAVTSAESAAASAQAQYDLALIAALNEQKATRIADWTASNPTDFNQPAWYFNQAEQIAALEAEAGAAQDALTKAIDSLKFVEEKATSAGFLNAEQRLAQARAAFQVATDVLDRTSSADQDLRDAAQTSYDDAKSELDDAQAAYDDVITTEGALDVMQARAELAVAQERFDVASDELRTLQTGLTSPKVVAAQKVVEQARAAVEQAKSAVSQAEANVTVIEAQLSKLVVTAPADGVILARNVEAGEVVNPGSVLLSIGKLSDLTLTVYVPEDRYGEVSLGQEVTVSVDSFPGESFTAVVVHIADQAEFTPRNVQTVEGRKTTVFAIKLRLDDPEGKLKPGMPADVTFK